MPSQTSDAKVRFRAVRPGLAMISSKIWHGQHGPVGMTCMIFAPAADAADVTNQRGPGQTNILTGVA